MKLKSGQIRGEGKRKKALRKDPWLKKTREIFYREGVVSWSCKPQERKGMGKTIDVGLLTDDPNLFGKSAKSGARGMNLPDNIDGIPIVYKWSDEPKLAAWETQNYFWTRPDDTDRDAFVNEPYTSDTDIQSLRKYQDPMHAGVEIFAESQHRHSMRGATLSSIVYDDTTNTPLLLSCAHVMCPRVFFGSTYYGLPEEDVGHQIYQPRYPDKAGTLLRWGTNDDVDGLNFDAAVATIDSGRSVRDGYYGSYGSIAKSEADDPVLDENVILTGRSSGRVSGKVVLTSEALVVKGILFEDIIRTDTHDALTGDSGSLLLRDSGLYNPLGIFFAYGGLVTNNSYFIKATNIAEDLGIHFYSPGGLIRLNMNAGMQDLVGGING